MKRNKKAVEESTRAKIVIDKLIDTFKFCKIATENLPSYTDMAASMYMMKTVK
jgi:hypothetical protein